MQTHVAFISLKEYGFLWYTSCPQALGTIGRQAICIRNLGNPFLNSFTYFLQAFLSHFPQFLQAPFFLPTLSSPEYSSLIKVIWI